VGIDAPTQARLFKPFTQADESITRRFGGTGLGLSICRELAELMGGEVGVSSTPGQGSCFHAELTLPPVAPPEHASRRGGLDADPLRGAHVLMVEDNAVNMMIGVAMLEQWGLEVGQASDGQQALDAVASRRSCRTPVRRRADGRANARHERLRGHTAPARTLSVATAAHHCADRGGTHVRARARRGRRHERLPHQAHRSAKRCAARCSGCCRATRPVDDGRSGISRA
jgi:CheY-like chemotaxis protein